MSLCITIARGTGAAGNLNCAANLSVTYISANIPEAECTSEYQNAWGQCRIQVNERCLTCESTYYPQLNAPCPLPPPRENNAVCNEGCCENYPPGHTNLHGYSSFTQCVAALTACQWITCCCPTGQECREILMPSGSNMTCTSAGYPLCTRVGSTGRFCDSNPCNLRGCCCPGGCQDVLANQPCPTGCTAKADGRQCDGAADPACGNCCACNRFCNLPAATCAAIGGVSGVTAAACAAGNVKPPCRKGFWKLGKRPTEHRTGLNRPAVNGLGIWSKQSTKDRDPAATFPPERVECRTTYGWTQKHATRGMVHGAICNTFNRNCPTQSRTTRKLKLVRHPTRGIMRIEGKYRRPCPETGDMGCANLVGCS